jgi:glucan endo-1,3-alpha-glucosidase
MRYLELLSHIVQDSLWAAVFATSSCTVTLTIGSSSQTFNVGAGVSNLQIPLAPGQITVTMVRNGQTVINQTPDDFTFITDPVLCEFRLYGIMLVLVSHSIP